MISRPTRPYPPRYAKPRVEPPKGFDILVTGKDNAVKLAEFLMVEGAQFWTHKWSEDTWCMTPIRPHRAFLRVSSLPIAEKAEDPITGWMSHPVRIRGDAHTFKDPKVVLSYSAPVSDREIDWANGMDIDE